MPNPMPPYERRPNRNAWGVSAAVGVFAGVVADIVIGHWSVHNGAFVAGQAFGIALMTAVPVAIIAWASHSRWPLWRYPAFIVPIALGLTVLIVLGDPADPSRTQQRRTAAAPAVVGAWTRDDSSVAKAQLQPAKDALEGRLGAEMDTSEMALYRSGGERAVLMIVTTQPGSSMDNDTRLSPRQAVVEELAGAGVDHPSMVDAGPLGGALGCGVSAKNAQVYMCSWAEFGMLGTLMLANTPRTADSAPQITRDFRSATEH